MLFRVSMENLPPPPPSSTLPAWQNCILSAGLLHFWVLAQPLPLQSVVGTNITHLRNLDPHGVMLSDTPADTTTTQVIVMFLTMLVGAGGNAGSQVFPLSLTCH